MLNYSLSIDPSNKASAWCLLELPTLKVIDFGFLEEKEMLEYIEEIIDTDEFEVYLAVEGMQNLGQVVGKDVFNTAYLIGRILERAYLLPRLNGRSYKDIKIIYRSEEKKTVCGKASRIKDKDIRQSLIDKFAQHDFKNGKGNKTNPDWFYGFARDEWSAFAVGYTAYRLYWKGELK